MNPFSLLYNELLFRPLFNLLVGIMNIDPTHSVGIAIIMLTIIVRLMLLPPSIHQARQMHQNQTKMAALQKDIAKIKKEHKDDSGKQAQETMKLYREAGVNPASGCLPLLIQLPILIALYRVFLTGITPESFSYLYPFVAAPSVVQQVFLGIDLAEPSVFLGAVAGVAQFVLMRFFTTMPTAQPGANDDTAQMMMTMQKNMMYIFPVMTVFIAFQLPAALAVYWVATTIFAIGQQYFIKRTLNVTTNMPVM